MKNNSNRYLCIHGHFYQPPRENPWADTIFIQKSAYPYHDWNERITRECYGPNTRSRLHGENGYISRLVNNFGQISFNFGPTLIKWLEKHSPWIYNQIIDADRQSVDRFSGHGNAIAQVYNHLIMPLASERDKITQVKWGLADFYYRFGRKAEGMWLSETAADSRTLAVLAREGVRFTILSPYQAHLVRPFSSDTGGSAWKDVSGGSIDCTRPYRFFPADDKNLFIDLFFYNGPLSKAIAYEKILASGEEFLKRITDTYPPDCDTPALMNMATDGESYGHHFKFGEMALTWVVETVSSGNDMKLTNYGEFLENFPPENEVKIIENSAWSCAHGIERWRSNCGCSLSKNPEWSQSWRAPLRNGLNWLNDHLSSIFEEKTKELLKECWKARNDYINILLNPDEYEKSTFLQNHAVKHLSSTESQLVFQLLESQQMALYMFTSCGWFFDDIAGLETVQILTYAKKAIELCRNLSAEDLEKGLKGFLSEAVCNDQKYKNGMEVYNKKVIPLVLGNLSLLSNYSIACAIDKTQVPEWLKILVNPETEEKIEKDGTTAYLCEQTVSSLNLKNEYNLVSIGLRTMENELTCISGVGNKQTAENLLKEINIKLLLNNESGSITRVLKKYLDNIRVFTLKDLIPDIKILVVKILSDQMHRSLFGSFIDDTAPVENYLNLLTMAGENVPARLDELIKSVFLNRLLKPLKNPADIPIDLSEAERFLEIFNHEPEEISPKNNDSLTPDDLVNQHGILLLIEEYLLGQINKLQGNNINLYLNNIINILNFISEYQINFDWWNSQNTFNDLRINNDFIEKLDKKSLSLFRQIEHLLGFTGDK